MSLNAIDQKTEIGLITKKVFTIDCTEKISYKKDLYLSIIENNKKIIRSAKQIL